VTRPPQSSDIDSAAGAARVQTAEPAESVAPTTGEPRVDAALERLQDVGAAPVDEHVVIYDDVHRRLQDALADLDGS
jgi:hypothetical protein